MVIFPNCYVYICYLDYQKRRTLNFAMGSILHGYAPV